MNSALAQTGGFASASTVRAEALVAGFFALALYLATLQRGVSLPDSAVVMEAMQGPVVSAFACNHTLNNLIGWLACRLLPYGTLAWRCNAVSALYGAGVVGLFHALVRRLGASRTLAALCTASLAVSHGVWWHATVVENYALSAVFFLACAHLLIAENVDAKVARRRLFALFFLAGLALLNHLQNGVLLVGCALALGRRPAQAWRPAAAGAVLGVVPWLAVVVWELSTGRAGAQPVSWFLGGGGFEQAMFRHETCGGLAELARLLVWHHPGPFACAVVIGLAWTLLPRAGAFRPLGRLVWAVVAGNALFFLGYATWDRFSFFLVPWVAADVAAAGWLVSCERRWPPARRRRLLVPALALGVAAAPLFYVWQTRRLAEAGRAGWLTRNYVQVAADYRERYDLAGMLLDPVRRDGGTIERFVRQALAALPPGAIWVDDGSTYDQVKWLQQREGLRTDVAVELIAHPLMPGRGAEARQLAMRCQWSGGGRRWFIVADRGPSAELIDALRPFGWRRVPYPVGEGIRLFELVQDEGAENAIKDRREISNSGSLQSFAQGLCSMHDKTWPCARSSPLPHPARGSARTGGGTAAGLDDFQSHPPRPAVRRRRGFREPGRMDGGGVGFRHGRVRFDDGIAALGGCHDLRRHPRERQARHRDPAPPCPAGHPARCRPG